MAEPKPKPPKKTVKIPPDDAKADRHKRPTNLIVNERVDFVFFLLQRRKYKSDVKRLFRKKYGIQSARTIEWYITRARARLIDQSQRSIEMHKLDAIQFYQSIVSGRGVDMSHRIHAQERLDHLLALAHADMPGVKGAKGKVVINKKPVPVVVLPAKRLVEGSESDDIPPIILNQVPDGS